jgi:hypothetical protein
MLVHYPLPLLNRDGHLHCVLDCTAKLPSQQQCSFAAAFARCLLLRIRPER